MCICSFPSSVDGRFLFCPTGGGSPSGMCDLNGRRAWLRSWSHLAIPNSSGCKTEGVSKHSWPSRPYTHTFWKVCFYSCQTQLGALNLFFQFVVFHAWRAQSALRFGQRHSWNNQRSRSPLSVCAELITPHLTLCMEVVLHTRSYQSTVITVWYFLSLESQVHLHGALTWQEK